MVDCIRLRDELNLWTGSAFSLFAHIVLKNILCDLSLLLLKLLIWSQDYLLKKERLFIEKGKIIYWKGPKIFFLKGRKNDTKRYNISYRTFPYLQLTLMTRAQCTNSYFSYCYSFDFWIFMQFCLPHAIFVCNSFVTFLQQMQWWVWTRLHIYGSIKWTSFM